MAVSLSDRVRPLRRVEYDQLIELGVFQNEKIELLDGVLVPMSPIGPPRASAVTKLGELLIPALLGRASVRIQNPFAALEISEPEPDAYRSVALYERGQSIRLQRFPDVEIRVLDVIK